MSNILYVVGDEAEATHLDALYKRPLFNLTPVLTWTQAEHDQLKTSLKNSGVAFKDDQLPGLLDKKMAGKISDKVRGEYALAFKVVPRMPGEDAREYAHRAAYRSSGAHFLGYHYDNVVVVTEGVMWLYRHHPEKQVPVDPAEYYRAMQSITKTKDLNDAAVA